MYTHHAPYPSFHPCLSGANGVSAQFVGQREKTGFGVLSLPRQRSVLGELRWGEVEWSAKRGQTRRREKSEEVSALRVREIYKMPALLFACSFTYRHET